MNKRPKRSAEYHAAVKALRQDTYDVAHKVRYTKALLDPLVAAELGEQCASIMVAVFQPGVNFEECHKALDTIYGLCLLAEAEIGPVQ